MDMDSAAEVRRNLHELQNLRSMASRSFVQNVLDREINNCQKRLDELRDTVSESSPSVAPAFNIDHAKSYHTTSPLPTVKLTNYAWDQSDKYVKLYLTIADIQSVPEEQISVKFSENQFDMSVSNVGGKNYALVMKGLLHEIDPSSSYYKQKTDSLLLMLKKKKEAEKWEYLTRAETISKKKNVPKFDDKADPQESLMTMLKQMYDEGDDDMKRTIRKAWHESQSKKTTSLGDDL